MYSKLRFLEYCELGSDKRNIPFNKTYLWLITNKICFMMLKSHIELFFMFVTPIWCVCEELDYMQTLMVLMFIRVKITQDPYMQNSFDVLFWFMPECMRAHLEWVHIWIKEEYQHKNNLPTSIETKKTQPAPVKKPEPPKKSTVEPSAKKEPLPWPECERE